MTIPKDRVAEWKAKYGRVFSVEYRKKDYVFRSLTFAEIDHLDNIASSWSSAQAEDHIVQIALLWPEDFDVDKLPASMTGLVTTLAEEINERSGQGTVYPIIQALNEAREERQSFRGIMETFVITTQPKYTVEDLAQMTIYELLDRVALAEEIIYLTQTTQGIPVEHRTRLIIKSPEEIEAENSERISDGGNATRADPIAQRLMQAGG